MSVRASDFAAPRLCHNLRVPVPYRVLLVLVAAVALNGCGGENEQPGTDRPAHATTEAGSPTTESSSEVDTSIQDALAERGVTDDMVRRLGAMADSTGYGYGPGTTLPFDQAQNFAVAVLVTCDQVVARTLTWDQAIRDDMSTGAPAGAAEKMNGYLRDVYCPALS